MREKILQLETFIDKLKRHKDSPTLIELAEFLLSLLTEGEAAQADAERAEADAKRIPDAEQPNNAALSGGETPSGENGKDSPQEVTSQSDTPVVSPEGGTLDIGESQGAD